MMPFSEINIYDKFQNPMHRGFGELSGLEWMVIEKNEKEKLVKVQGCSYATGDLIGAPIWKKPSDRMFSDSWKVFDGRSDTRGGNRR